MTNPGDRQMAYVRVLLIVCATIITACLLPPPPPDDADGDDLDDA